jgi:16S rRNA (guanine1207-N2)-methyltransferase
VDETLNEIRRPGAYGTPPVQLAAVPERAVQFSPLLPGSSRLEDQEEGALASMVVLAPPGTVERRYVLALALRALAPGAALTALAPKDKGGSRLGKELARFGCAVSETSKRHHRICITCRPSILNGLEEAIAAGGPRLDPALGLWTQPGVFSWDRIDPGSALLAENLPPLSGRGADFGCGIGYLAHAILASPKVQNLILIDVDRRAVDAASRNAADPRVAVRWADIRHGAGLSGLDFVVMNPPFHDGGLEDQGLGQAFIRRAAEALRPGGLCCLVANRHLSYEAVIKPLFRRIELRIETGGYKVYEAHK